MKLIKSNQDGEPKEMIHLSWNDYDVKDVEAMLRWVRDPAGWIFWQEVGQEAANYDVASKMPSELVQDVMTVATQRLQNAARAEAYRTVMQLAEKFKDNYNDQVDKKRRL